ncbi:alpha/beta fold hydrolase [Amnibacterium kyonggiense]
MADRLVTLRDGRRLGLTTFGDPVAERIVVLCHPAPGAGGFDPAPAVTSAWGVHVVSVDRPGYGSSTPLPDDLRPTIGRWADDLAEYVEFVIEQAREAGYTPLHRIGVVGWSAGGRVALALAARHPGLVDRVAVVATPAPDAEVRWIPPELARASAELLQQPVPVAKQRLREMLRAQVPDGRPDVELLADGAADLALLDRDGLRGRLQRMLQHAYDQGTVGLADDLLSYVAEDWDFDLAAVRAPTLLVYGAKDPIAPSAHGRWYRRHLPNAHARLTVVARAGHLVVAPAWERVLQHVDPQHGSRSDV